MTKLKSAAERRRESAQLLKIADQFLEQPAQLTPPLVTEMECVASKDSIARRIALYSLTRSGLELVNALKHQRDHAVAYVRAADQTERYASRLRSLAELMETAALRLRIAVCFRDDMQSVQEEAHALEAGQAVGHG